MIIPDEETDWSVFQNKKDQAAADGNAVSLAAPVPLRLGNVGLLLLSSPTPDDEMLIRTEYRRQCLELLKSPLQQIMEDVKKLPPALAEIAVRTATMQQVGDTGKAEPNEDSLIGRLYTPDGCAFRIWILARRQHPDLKLADVRAEINEVNVVEILANLLVAFEPTVAAVVQDEKKAGASTSEPSGESSGPGSTAG